MKKATFGLVCLLMANQITLTRHNDDYDYADNSRREGYFKNVEKRTGDVVKIRAY